MVDVQTVLQVNYFHVVRIIYRFKIGHVNPTLLEQNIHLLQNRVQHC